MAGERSAEVVVLAADTDEDGEVASRARSIVTQPPHPGVVVLPQDSSRQERPTDVDIAALVYAIEAATSGLVVFDPAISRSPQLLHGPRLTALSPRQRHVLQLMAEGHNNSSIARALVVTEKSVENVINSVFRRLEIPKRGAVDRRVTAALSYLGEARRA